MGRDKNTFVAQVQLGWVHLGFLLGLCAGSRVRSLQLSFGLPWERPAITAGYENGTGWRLSMGFAALTWRATP